MFDYGLSHWVAFFSASFLLTLSPGPDLAFILAQTLKRGRKAGFVAMFGIWTGAFFHVFLAAAGLSAILATSATAFSIVKLCGASYLIWLGVQSFRVPAPAVNKPEPPLASTASVFRQGMVVAVLNPKTAIFFLSFLPQFVEAGAGPTQLQLLLHGSLVIAVAIFIEPLAIITGAALSERFTRKSAFKHWLDRLLGAFFIGMGLRLILLEKN